jgi:cell division protein FtsL
LEGKQRLNFDEKLDADSSFRKKFEKANKEADENERLKKVTEQFSKLEKMLEKY